MTGRYIIKNATVVSVDPSIGVKYNFDVTIEDNVIAAVGQDLEVAGHEIIDGRNAIVSPGFIDTHRHSWQTQTRTIAGDHVLSDYLASLRHVYGSCYTPEDVYLGNLVGALESIDNGITYLVDHSHIMNSPDHADAAIKALRESGIRSVFCYGLWPNPYWLGSAVDAEQDKKPNWRLHDAKRVKETHFRSNKPTDIIRFGLAPQEPEGGLPIEDFISEIKVGRDLGASIITAHIALGHWGRGNYVVRKLQEAGMLGPDLLLSHCAALEEDEIAAVNANGVSVSTTPDTEMQMAMGHPIAFKLKDLGGSYSANPGSVTV
jgi:cytosine/adenosine deaminase-related metal-dependent hydrolase